MATDPLPSDLPRALLGLFRAGMSDEERGRAVAEMIEQMDRLVDGDD